jgi:hypothetical protein
MTQFHNTVREHAVLAAVTLVVENELATQRVFYLSIRRSLELLGLGKVQQLGVVGQIVTLLLHFQLRSLTLELKSR